MTKQQEILTRINILTFQIAEAVVNGGLNMKWVKKSSDEIDVLIGELEKKPKRTNL